MNPRLSIIIPTYNVLPYLRKCLDSVLAAASRVRQSGAIEIICVDDGATDGSAAVLDEYASKKTGLSFRVLHRKNGGVSVARNASIKAATGDWLHFIDADDWVDEGIYEKLFAQIAEHPDADVIAFAAAKMDELGSVQKIICGDCRRAEMPGDELLGRLPYLPLSGCIWNKIYRREIVMREQLRFLAGVQPAEDDLFNILYMTYACKVVIRPEIVGYNYRATPGSSVHTMNVRKLMYQTDEFAGLLVRWNKIRTPGLTWIMTILAKRLVFLGAGSEVRGECVARLAHSDVFNLQVVPFLLKFGDLKCRLFAAVYLLLPSTKIKCKILNQMAK